MVVIENKSFVYHLLSLAQLFMQRRVKTVRCNWNNLSNEYGTWLYQAALPVAFPLYLLDL
jgi:hypothetical protein